MPFPLRRAVLASLVLAGVFAACGYARMDEGQVRARGAERLSCEEQLVKVEGSQGPAAGIARFEVRGCGRSTVLDCTADDAGVVSCWRAGRPKSAPDGDEEQEGDSVSSEVAAAAVGCACASLFAAHGRSSSSSPAPSSDPSPTSTTTSSSSGAVPINTAPKK